MLQDLDKTLEVFLRAELPPELSGLAISFAAPDDKFPPSGVTLPAISLFLSGVQENHDLRQTEPITKRLADGTQTVVRPPPRVDCYYVACAFSNAQTKPEEDEHRILGEVMRAFFRFREIPAQALQGTLQNQAVPIRASTPLPTTRESGVEFWQAFKVQPRAALHYVVTISVDPAYPDYPAPPVTSVHTSAAAAQPPGFQGVDVDYAPLAVKGTVTDALSKQPLAKAIVQLTSYPPAFGDRLAAAALRAGAAWSFLPSRLDRAVTNADGSYRFYDLPSGAYAASVTLPSAGTRYGTAALASIGVTRDAQGVLVTATADAALPPSAIAGRVVAASGGAAIPMSEVRIQGSGESTFTQSDGSFVLAGVEPGARTLVVLGPALAPKTIGPVAVQRGQTTTIPDVTL